MHTAEASRRHGFGSTILRHIIDEARRASMTRLSLETGSWDYFRPAVALYKRHGFIECGPFAHYWPDRSSVFMTLDLSTPLSSAPEEICKTGREEQASASAHPASEQGKGILGHVKTAEINGLIVVIQALVKGRDDRRAMAMCGSWAQGNAQPDSHLDVLIIAQDHGPLRRDQKWIRELKFSDAGFS